MIRATLTITLLLVVLKPQARAQSPTRTLSLREAITIAVENNRELKSARMEMEKADHRVREAIGSALPNISASGLYTRALKKQVFFLPEKFINPDAVGDNSVPMVIGSDNSIQFGISATQILFNSAVFTGVGASKIYQRASREMYRASLNATVANVKRAFYGVHFTQQVLKLTKASMQNAEDNLKNVRIFFKQGIVSEYDFIRAEVQTENIRPMVIEAERNVVVATNGLKLLLAIDPKEHVTASGELEFEPLDPAIIESAEQRVLDQNAQLKALGYQTDVSEELISIYRSEMMPTLAAFGNYMWQAQRNTFDIFNYPFVQTAQVGLSLSFSLFSGMQTSARIDQAKIDHLKSEEQLHSARDGMRTNVQSIRLRLETARKRIDGQARTVEQAEKGYKIATTRYASGSGTQLEVNDADLALMRARVNRIQAIFDYANARIDLEEIMSIEQTASTE